MSGKYSLEATVGYIGWYRRSIGLQKYGTAQQYAAVMMYKFQDLENYKSKFPQKQTQGFLHI